jgi:hypothetical protein
MRPVRHIIAVVLTLILACSSVCAQPQYFGTIRGDSACVNFGYRLMPLGSQNGDTPDDMLIFDCGPAIEVLFGGSSLPDHEDLRISPCLNLLNPLGDVNGDGYNDLALSHSSHKLGLYYGGPLLDSVLDIRFGLDTLWGLGILLPVSA